MNTKEARLRKACFGGWVKKRKMVSSELKIYLQCSTGAAATGKRNRTPLLCFDCESYYGGAPTFSHKISVTV